MFAARTTEIRTIRSRLLGRRRESAWVRRRCSRVYAMPRSGLTRDVCPSLGTRQVSPHSPTINRILVVEDDVDFAEALQDVFELSNAEVVITGDAASAVKILNTQSFDLCLSDLKLPGELSGLEVLQEAQALNPAARVVIMSAFTRDPRLDRALMQGALCVINKPFDAECFLQSMQSMCATGVVVARLGSLALGSQLRHIVEGLGFVLQVFGSDEAAARRISAGNISLLVDGGAAARLSAEKLGVPVLRLEPVDDESGRSELWWADGEKLKLAICRHLGKSLDGN